MIVWILHLIVWVLMALGHLWLLVWLSRRSGKGGSGKEQARRLTMVYGGLSAIWILSGALQSLTEPAPMIGGATTAIFSGLFPVIAGLSGVLERAFSGKEPNRQWSIAGSVWGVLTCVVGVYAWLSGNIPWWVSIAISGLGWAILWIVLSVIWARQYVHIEWAFQRNQSLYWAWASVLLILGQMLVLLTPWVMGTIGLLLHLCGLLAITYAITRRQLPNVRDVLRRSFLFVVMAALTAVLLIASQLLLTTLFSLPRAQLLQPAAIGLAIFAATILALVYRPLRKRVERLSERLVPHTGYNMDAKLREYSIAIANVIDLEDLATVAVDMVSTVLDVQRCALILVNEEEHEMRLRPLKGRGGVSMKEIRFGSFDPVIAHLGGQQKSLSQRSLVQDTVFQNLLPKVQTWIKDRMGMEVYVPIFAQSTFIGILAVGPPRSGEPFGERDHTFLTMLAHQTAVALQNARLFDNMHALNFQVTQLNEDLRRAMARVKRLDQEKTDFLSVTSHELRTPLTHVKGYADLLTELGNVGALTPKQTTEIVGSIGRAAVRLENIVSAMTDLSQIEEDKLDIFFAPTTLKAVLRLAVEPWHESIQQRNLQFGMTGIDDIPPIVVDLQRLSQIFGNLISNAIKYTPDGRTIAVRAQQLDETRFEVIVSDTGVGIAPDDQDLIFDKFFRVGSIDHHSSSESKFKGGGPGLGLSITKGIIEAHGGRIWVESEGYDEERCPGSTFHVILPLEAHPPDTN
ncbi:MAG: GAF domain-containing sensor histidine kinase [Chloroflexi bacterium]|nr:GAF domain-containing sensor histidine kinase [Chloroflexota bacterium]